MADSARVTVTLAADLVEGIDRIERNRSRFIAEAVEAGLGDWVSDLRANEGLVDVAAGTPVRRVEGQGWTKDRG